MVALPIPPLRHQQDCLTFIVTSAAPPFRLTGPKLGLRIPSLPPAPAPSRAMQPIPNLLFPWEIRPLAALPPAARPLDTPVSVLIRRHAHHVVRELAHCAQESILP